MKKIRLAKFYVDSTIRKYSVEKKPMWKIAKELSISVGSVYNILKQNEIPVNKYVASEGLRKKRSELMRGRKRPPMSEEQKEKIRQAHLGKYRDRTEFGGHKKKRADGYISIYCPNNPRANADGYAMEHVLVMEKHIGRPLRHDEVVHHINHIRNDNRIENLQLMTFKEHCRLHMIERWEAKRRNDLLTQ